MVEATNYSEVAGERYIVDSDDESVLLQWAIDRFLWVVERRAGISAYTERAKVTGLREYDE